MGGEGCGVLCDLTKGLCVYFCTQEGRAGLLSQCNDCTCMLGAYIQFTHHTPTHTNVQTGKALAPDNDSRSPKNPACLPEPSF